MRKLALFVAVAALVLLTASVVSARCLDENCRAVRPTVTATLLPLWTPTAPAALELPATDAPPSGYPALPDTPAPANGYPAVTPTATAYSTATAYATPGCSLDWSLPVTGNNWNLLQDCFGRLALLGYPPADICPPAGSPWSTIFFGPAGYCD